MPIPQWAMSVGSGMIYSGSLVFPWTALNPSIYQETDATAAATGDTLTLHAQDCSGAGSTGGALVCRGGSGVLVGGALYLAGGAGPTPGAVVIQPGGVTAVTIGPNAVTCAETGSDVTIGLAQRTSNNLTNDILIVGQQGAAGSTGTNRNGGDVWVIGGTPEGAGTQGGAYLRSASYYIGIVNNTTTCAAYLKMAGGVGNIYWIATNTTPALYQENTAVAGVTAQTLTVQAQNATGTGATVGGKLVLTSGTGATNGAVEIQIGGVAKLSIYSSGSAQFASGVQATTFTNTGAYTSTEAVDATFKTNVRTSDAATRTTYIQAQEPYTLATGASRKPGDLICSIGTPTNAGTTHGSFKVNVASSTVLECSKSAAGNATWGMYGATPVEKPTVSGSIETNDALSSLLTSLASQGVITNSTTGAAVSSYLKVKSGTFSRTSDTTLTDVTNMSFAIGANEVWFVEFHGDVTFASAGEFSTAVTVPAGATLAACTRGTSNGDSSVHVYTNTSGGRMDIDFAGANTAGCFVVHATIINGANAGTVQLQFAQRASNATPSAIAAGMFLAATKGTSVA